MTKRMIDADAVGRILVGIMKRGSYNIMGVEYSIDVPILQNIMHRINELATPAPEPQESIFDADRWCWDMDSLHDYGDVLLYVINPDLKTKRATVGKKIDKNFYFARVSERDRPNAWRPLPTLPKDKP